MKPVDKKANPGLAKLPTKVRNKMGYMKHGGTVHEDTKAMMHGGEMKTMMKGGEMKATKATRQGRAMLPGKMSKNLPMIAAQSAYQKGGEAKATAYDKKQDKKMTAHASTPAKTAHKKMGGMMKKMGGMMKKNKC